MELGPRDRLSQAFIGEFNKGRTTPGPYGHVVFLDIRHLGEKKIDKKIPFGLILRIRHFFGFPQVILGPKILFCQKSDFSL